MKNYLLFIIDSLNYSHVKDKMSKLMPFCNEIIPESIVCNNMYSQAPYTEAAVMNIYCGQNVLDNGGYLKRFKDASKTIFEVFKEAGYKTFYNSFQPQCYPSSLRRGVDELYYNVGYDLGALWSYRLSHYAALLRNEQIKEEDYVILEDIFEDNFTEWEVFVEKYLAGDKSCEMISANNKAYDGHDVLERVKKQKNLFIEDKRSYINSVLKEGTTHCLFDIPAYVQDYKIKDDNVRRQLRKIFKPVARKIRRKDFFYNIKNNKGFAKGTFKRFGKFITHPSKNTLKDFLKSAQFTANIMFDLDLGSRINKKCDTFKAAPSARTHIDQYINWAKENRNCNHFACIHVDDIHNPEMFFTYDTNDVELLKRERDDAMEVIKSLDKKYKGSITHDLSLRYIDRVIEYMFSQLKDNGMLDDTCVVITADHGFSFSANPVRDTFVTNLYLENYNIPCIIYNSSKDGFVYNELCTSKDIPATLCDIAFGRVPEEFNGQSILNKQGYSNLFIEYCGGGCPDLTRRDIKLAAFDKSLFVGTLCDLNKELGDSQVTEIYDLENDPLQKKNLANGDYNFEEVQIKLEAIKNRRKEIISNNL